MPPPPLPRWQRRPEARPEEILDAALAVFGESGFARAKIDDVARLAGVSKGTRLPLLRLQGIAVPRDGARQGRGLRSREAEAFVRTYEGSARALLVELIRRMYAPGARERDDAASPGSSRVSCRTFPSWPASTLTR